MARSPKLVLDEEAVEAILSLTANQRRRVIAALEGIRDGHPFETEDFAETDATGRHVSVKAARPVLITYWLDGPVDELRVTRIMVVKPWREKN